MQDRLKFRAKLKNIDNWIYGAYLKMLPYQPNPVGHIKPLETEYKHLIITEGSADWGMPREIAAYEVIAETVGQSTGLKDKNGKLIYEGDIVRYKDEVYGLCIGRIEWDNAHYELQYYTGEQYGWFSHILCFKHIKNIEVIGNIYEDSHLIER